MSIFPQHKNFYDYTQNFYDINVKFKNFVNYTSQHFDTNYI